MKAKRFKINAISLSIFLAYALTPYSEAALVRDDVDYQIFRDFAENKGKFFVGATDLSVKNKQGQNIGNALSNVPMIDFSVADVNKRIANGSRSPICRQRQTRQSRSPYFLLRPIQRS